jgi:hypothetical protein
MLRGASNSSEHRTGVVEHARLVATELRHLESHNIPAASSSSRSRQQQQQAAAAAQPMKSM